MSKPITITSFVEHNGQRRFLIVSNDDPREATEAEAEAELARLRSAGGDVARELRSGAGTLLDALVLVARPGL